MAVTNSFACALQFPLLLIVQQGVKDLVSHHLLFLIGWKDAQIVGQLRQTMTNPAPTSLVRHQQQANSPLSLGYCTQHVISMTDKNKLLWIIPWLI
jgi:hypothetical protein